MASFEDMWRVLFPFLIVWILYTLVICRKAIKCGTSFMNKENLLFVGYVGLTIGLGVTAIFSTFRL